MPDLREKLEVEEQTITPANFIENALTAYDDPQKRIHPVVQQRIQNQAGMFFDVHAHCFNFENVPTNFLRTRLDIPSWLIGSLVVKSVTKLLAIIPDSAVLSILAYKESRKIAESLIKCYRKRLKKEKGRQNIPHLLVVMLSMNMDYAMTPDEPAREKFPQQLDSLVEVCNFYINNPKGQKLNTSIIPYVAIDPNQKSAYQTFLNAFATNQSNKKNYAYPFYGVKLYPCLGYLPTHPVLMNIYEICVKKNIPILTHCGGVITRTDAKTVDVLHQDAMGNITKENKVFYTPGDKNYHKNYELFFLEPNRWRTILIHDKYKDLYLNIAHLGGDDQWEDYLKNPGNPKNFVFQTLELIEEFDNVYADISYSLAADKNLYKIKELMLNESRPKIREKLLFGSDFYVMLKAQKMNGAIKDFYRIFGDHPELIQKLTIDNPRKYLRI